MVFREIPGLLLAVIGWSLVLGGPGRFLAIPGGPGCVPGGPGRYTVVIQLHRSCLSNMSLSRKLSLRELFVNDSHA